MIKAVIVSGYFNPIHKGHLEYFHNAKSNGDALFVIVNSDHQRALKGSKEFQDEQYTEMTVTPRYEKQVFSDPIVTTFEVPVIAK